MIEKNNTLQTPVKHALLMCFVGLAIISGCKLPSKDTTAFDDTQKESAEGMISASGLAQTDAMVNNDGSTPMSLASTQSPNTGVVYGRAGRAVKLTIRQVAPNAGPVRIAAFRPQDNFPDHSTAVAKSNITSDTGIAIAEMQDLPEGPLAFAVYQDTNNDGKLNRGSFGIPTEPYGFSNDAKGTMGPPGFKDAAVDNTESKPVSVTLSKISF